MFDPIPQFEEVCWSSSSREPADSGVEYYVQYYVPFPILCSFSRSSPNKLKTYGGSKHGP